ncbi:hypothetical protein MUK42_37264 [Musa troglodytarum]|uniref:Uncharacterized protein n=1 Tax=Musa troglodytarum TaxID=320322 RepID=A0A9E7G7W1_9LILI|nr:hypothetical protein MUK42_37264 [Musa troglodytarum]
MITKKVITCLSYSVQKDSASALPCSWQSGVVFSLLLLHVLRNLRSGHHQTGTLGLLLKA